MNRQLEPQLFFRVVFFVITACVALPLYAGDNAVQVSPATKTAPSPSDVAPTPMAPAVLPGTGLAQHDFFYSGEYTKQWMFIVRKGKIVWSYIDNDTKGEISDSVLLSNGNILFAHQFGITLITPDKKVLWHYDAPPGTETHIARPIGTEHVLFIQNGDPAFVRVVNIKTRQTRLQFNLPVGNPKSVHPQFRDAQITEAGTLLVGHMDNKKVAEYDASGKEVWSYAIDSPWSVQRLKNGNTLIATNKQLVREVDHNGNTVWELTPQDLPDYKILTTQVATRLPNGNTLISNWLNSWHMTLDPSNPPVQAIEVTREKKVVWALRSWTDPADLGPGTRIQLLDVPFAPENVNFGGIR